MLIMLYNDVNKPNKQIEFVYVPLDNELDQYKEYITTMPWKAMKFGDKKIDQLTSKFEVTGIPRLIIIKPDGEVIKSNAKGDVMTNGSDAVDDWLKL